jgi:ribA/ribD-fused uncharacterized protein
MIKIPYYENSYFALHNFSAHSVLYKGVIYPTVEHAYHSSKFKDEKIKKEIQNAGSPLLAYELGQKYKSVRRNGWDEIKVGILEEIISEKVKQHEEVKNALLATGDEEIVEENPNDDFWGSGKDGNGQNHTGKILMRIRGELLS